MSSGRTSRTIRGIAASALGLAVLASSAHAATGWTPPFDLGGPSFNVGYVVMDTDGTVVISGIYNDGVAYHGAMRIRPPGGPLGPIQIVTQTSGTPAVAPRPDGGFFGAWLENT